MYDSNIRASGDVSGRRLFTYQSKKIGFKIEFTGITSNDDSTLFDNAQNYPNYNAPGADRLKAIITAISEEFDPTSVESYKSKTSDGKDFIELVRFKKGVIQSIKKDTEYNEILGLFAGRTYDESGSYTVNPFKLEIKEHLKRDLFKINLTSFSTTPEVGDMVFKTSDGSSLTNLVFLSQTPTGNQFYPNASTVTTPIGVIKKIDLSTTSIYVEMLNKYSFSTLGASTLISAKSSDGGSVYSIGQTKTTNMVVFIPDNTGLYTLSDTINPGSEDKAAIIISPGKGYIEGFKVENFNSSFIDVPKGRSSDHLVTDSSSIDFSELENVMYLEQDAGISLSTIDISSEYINIYGDSSYVKVLFAGVTSKDYAEGTVQSWTPFENGNLVNKNTPNSIIPLLNKQSVLFITAENEPII
jgi:hypothetical protein